MDTPTPHVLTAALAAAPSSGRSGEESRPTPRPLIPVPSIVRRLDMPTSTSPVPHDPRPEIRSVHLLVVVDRRLTRADMEQAS